jgi:hypothetical protein
MANMLDLQCFERFLVRAQVCRSWSLPFDGVDSSTQRAASQRVLKYAGAHSSAKHADLFAIVVPGAVAKQTKTVLVGLPFHFLNNYGPIAEAQVNYVIRWLCVLSFVPQQIQNEDS